MAAFLLFLTYGISKGRGVCRIKLKAFVLQ